MNIIAFNILMTSCANNPYLLEKGRKKGRVREIDRYIESNIMVELMKNKMNGGKLRQCRTIF